MIFGDAVASATTSTSSRRAANIRLRTMITHRTHHRVGFGFCKLQRLQSCVCGRVGATTERRMREMRPIGADRDRR